MHCMLCVTYRRLHGLPICTSYPSFRTVDSFFSLIRPSHDIFMRTHLAIRCMSIWNWILCTMTNNLQYSLCIKRMHACGIHVIQQQIPWYIGCTSQESCKSVLIPLIVVCFNRQIFGLHSLSQYLSRSSFTILLCSALFSPFVFGLDVYHLAFMSKNSGCIDAAALATHWRIWIWGASPLVSCVRCSTGDTICYNFGIIFYKS